MVLKSRTQNTEELLMPIFFQKKLSPCLLMLAISGPVRINLQPHLPPTFKVNLPKRTGSNSLLLYL